MSAVASLPALRGTVEPGGSLADFIWFRTGGPAEWLVRPADVQDLASFMAGVPGGWLTFMAVTEQELDRMTVPGWQETSGK